MSQLSKNPSEENCINQIISDWNRGVNGEIVGGGGLQTPCQPLPEARAEKSE